MVAFHGLFFPLCDVVLTNRMLFNRLSVTVLTAGRGLMHDITKVFYGDLEAQLFSELKTFYCSFTANLASLYITPLWDFTTSRGPMYKYLDTLM